MTQTFYTKWQSSVLADAGNYVSKEYNNFQTALLSEISKYAKAVDAAVVSENKGHYYTSCFIERNGKFVYLNHSADVRMDDGIKIELDSFMIRTISSPALSMVTMTMPLGASSSIITFSCALAMDGMSAITFASIKKRECRSSISAAAIL